MSSRICIAVAACMGKEKAVWIWNRTSPVLLVAFALMIVLKTQRLFPDDRMDHQQVQAEVAKGLARENRFQDVRVGGEGRTVILRGTVALLQDRRYAIRRVSQIEDVKSVVSHIKVEAEKVPDGLLVKQLQERLAENDNPQIKVKVKKGVVTIQGAVQDDVHRESVLSTVAGTAGVIGMKDRLKVLAD